MIVIVTAEWWLMIISCPKKCICTDNKCKSMQVAVHEALFISGTHRCSKWDYALYLKTLRWIIPSFFKGQHSNKNTRTLAKTVCLTILVLFLEVKFKGWRKSQVFIISQRLKATICNLRIYLLCFVQFVIYAPLQSAQALRHSLKWV